MRRKITLLGAVVGLAIGWLLAYEGRAGVAIVFALIGSVAGASIGAALAAVVVGSISARSRFPGCHRTVAWQSLHGGVRRDEGLAVIERIPRLHQ
jgi:hypothetical protein